MILLGTKNKTHFIASVDRHDYVYFDEMIADGGQPSSNTCAGYTRFNLGGDIVYAQVKQEFDELYNDYQFNNPRKYGVWSLDDVEILTDYHPNEASLAWKADRYVWGTRGKNGYKKLKYVLLKNCDTEHLNAILDTQYQVNDETREVINYILENRK